MPLSTQLRACECKSVGILCAVSICASSCDGATLCCMHYAAMSNVRTRHSSFDTGCLLLLLRFLWLLLLFALKYFRMFLSAGFLYAVVPCRVTRGLNNFISGILGPENDTLLQSSRCIVVVERLNKFMNVVAWSLSHFKEHYGNMSSECSEWFLIFWTILNS